MKEKIINEILNLKSGEQFSIGEYLEKYNMTDTKQGLTISLDIIESLGDNIEPLSNSQDDLIEIVGLPQYITYVRK